MFDKILIANRGEIACRIINTCRRLGVATVAIYSDADADALHVRLADEAYRVGSAPARDSYLVAERAIDIARGSGAQAIHPGYGFLSENPEFARRTLEAGLVFIGPTPQAMRAMSSKANARELAQRVGVPVLPGYQGEPQDGARLRREAERIGYPVLIKAVSGGGGRGMRQVDRPADFDAALLACQREAAASFGDSRVLLEKYLANPRHIEVQVFGDAVGNVVHLYERDCSAQRRHQKVIEESPAPSLDGQRREALVQAACQAAGAAGYSGAGTVEFLFDHDGGFYFIEMNTRIQVEHPVTEMVTGLDLVEWQLRVAAGEPLPLTQQQIRQHGHAIEARLYAEQPEAGFLPSSGTLGHFAFPETTSALRIETGLEMGDRVGIDYDPMLAKLIAYGPTRSEALARLQSALSQTRVLGVSNNLFFLQRLLASEVFRAGAVDTGYIERALPELLRPESFGLQSNALILAGAALFTLERERRANLGGTSPWQRADGWRLNGWLRRRLRFEWLRSESVAAPRAAESSAPTAAPNQVEVEYQPHGVRLRIGSEHGEATLHALGGDLYQVRFADRSMQLQIIAESAGPLRLRVRLNCYRLRCEDPFAATGDAVEVERSLAAPMPGRIIAQLAVVGQGVAKGEPLLTIEAMKMEHTLCAPADGRVRGYHASVGEQIREGQELIDFETTPAGPAPIPRSS